MATHTREIDAIIRARHLATVAQSPAYVVIGRDCWSGEEVFQSFSETIREPLHTVQPLGKQYQLSAIAGLHHAEVECIHPDGSITVDGERLSTYRDVMRFLGY